MAATKPKKPRAMVKMIGYRKELKQARNAVRYVCFRSEDVKGREAESIFDASSDHPDVSTFNKGLDDPVSRHPKAAKVYHLLFSLSRRQYDDAGMEGWRDTVRTIMRQYEAEYKVKLEWIAAEHMNEKHPHVHVIIKAVYTDPESGRRRRLFLGRPNVEKIKDLATRELEARGVVLSRGPWERRRAERQRFAALGTAFMWLQRQIKAHRDQQAYEEEQEQRRRGRSR